MREPGCYWVFHNRWVIAEWSEEYKWELTGFSDSRKDSDFDEIDERRIERQAEPDQKPISEVGYIDE